jgi:hypothetical protein
MEKLTDEIFERLYVPVGRFVVYWGAVDVAVNHVAFAIFRHINTTPQAQRWPLGLHYRLKRLKSLIGKHPDFKPFAKDAREVFRDTLHQLKDREMLAHGVAVRYIRDKDTILFERIDELTKGQRKRSGHVTHRLNFQTVFVCRSRHPRKKCRGARRRASCGLHRHLRVVAPN